MLTIYEQDDTYTGQSYEEAKPYIQACIATWSITKLDKFIAEEFDQLNLIDPTVLAGTCTASNSIQWFNIFGVSNEHIKRRTGGY